MRNNKNGLDEMQRERRNSIGNQMFILLAYALIFNGGLYSAEIRWLDYPANVMVITTVCMAIYLVRLIAFTLAAINLFGQSLAQITESSEDNSAVILMIVSAVGLLATLIVAVIKKANNKDDKDD